MPFLDCWDPKSSAGGPKVRDSEILGGVPFGSPLKPTPKGGTLKNNAPGDILGRSRLRQDGDHLPPEVALTSRPPLWTKVKAPGGQASKS